MSYPEGFGCWGLREDGPGAVWSLRNGLALGWERHACGFSQLRAGGREVREGALFSHDAFLSHIWLQPQLSLPVSAHAWLIPALSCPHPCLCSPLLPARAPHEVKASPWACLARWIQYWL